MSLFQINELYPHPNHYERIQRYRENKKLFTGEHFEAFKYLQNRLEGDQSDLVYISVNLPGIIAKKSADFLFGSEAIYNAGKKEDNAPEQLALERIAEQNELNITNYQSALGNAYRGDSFYKIRWGQEYEGMVDKEFDPFRAIIEPQNPEYVFPETLPGNANKIFAFHIAYPTLIKNGNDEFWKLTVESHYPGYINYHEYVMETHSVTRTNEVLQWRIIGTMGEPKRVPTDVPFPLVVHVPNFATDDSWEGIDDISEHKSIFDEINNRLSQIALILDKHSDPAMAVPAGTLAEDENGNPTFNVQKDKVFEIMGKDDIVPSYLTWNGQLQAGFEELKKLIEYLLMTAELPEVALGGGNSGTSGSSGLAIKFRLNSLLAKINRKRLFYDKGLKAVFKRAQELEHARSVKKPDYEITVPKIKFKDGLPEDDSEQANVMSIRTGGKPTISQKTALMEMDGLTEEQADAELERIKKEQEAEELANPSAFNKEVPNHADNGDTE